MWYCWTNQLLVAKGVASPREIDQCLARDRPGDDRLAEGLSPASRDAVVFHGLSVSIGFVVHPEGLDFRPQTFQRAGANLYPAKLPAEKRSSRH